MLVALCSKALSGRVVGVFVFAVAIVFFMMSSRGGFFLPNHDMVQNFMGLDPVEISKGRVWLLFSSLFVSIGILHFVVCALSLWVAGKYLESNSGSRSFALTFVVCGFFANLVSLIFSTQVGSGLSGAVVGVLCAGLWLINKSKKNSGKLSEENLRLQSLFWILTAMIFLTGFISPLIGHVAYVGGALIGAGLGYIWSVLKDQSLDLWEIKFSPRSIGLVLTVLSLVLGFAIVPKLVAHRLTINGNYFYELYQSQNKQNVYADHAIYFYSRALEINSNDKDLLLRRGQIFYRQDRVQEALDDFRVLLKDVDYQKKLEDFAETYSKEGQPVLAIYSLLNHNKRL